MVVEWWEPEVRSGQAGRANRFRHRFFGVLERSRARFPFVRTVFADGGYSGRLVAWANDKPHVNMEIVRRMPWMKGFVVIRRR